MTTTYPAIDELKAQAKRLRQAMNDRGTALTHSAALEMIARQHGARAWTTRAALAAKANAAAKTPLYVGAVISISRSPAKSSRSRPCRAAISTGSPSISTKRWMS